MRASACVLGALALFCVSTAHAIPGYAQPRTAEQQAEVDRARYARACVRFRGKVAIWTELASQPDGSVLSHAGPVAQSDLLQTLAHWQAQRDTACAAAA